MRVGLDIHGCIDKYPEFFRDLSFSLVFQGHEVHIVTGQEREKVEPELVEFDIRYTHFYSIVDYHLEIGTKMWTKNGREGWWMDEDKWLPSKGDYAERVGLDAHFDDSWEYVAHFPNSCTFILVGEGFEKLGYLWQRMNLAGWENSDV